jgi:menaquinone reductase, iron-sulfur cluster-binding subunit
MSVEKNRHRFGMVIDIDKCTGCGACMVACAVENNVPPARSDATERTGITWIRVHRMDNGAAYPEAESVFVPISCQQCNEHPPCVSVCPQNAVELDPKTGIVAQIAERCLGCRYCMAACPYHARYFNWGDPEWPSGMEQALNPDVSPRMRGVAEKCNFCHGRLHAAQARAAAAGSQTIEPSAYVPACGEACPAGAITFGDLEDPGSGVARLAADQNSFRLLPKIGTEPKVYYRSRKQWVRELAQQEGSPQERKSIHG